MRMRTIREKWESYLARVVPPGASPTQVTETRRAFYGGALSLLDIVRQLPADDDAGVAELQALYDECRAFHKQVVEGEA